MENIDRMSVGSAAKCGDQATFRKQSIGEDAMTENQVMADRKR
jgi:hypothetical protein